MAVQAPSLINKFDAVGGVNPRSASGAITATEVGTAFTFSGKAWLNVNVSALDIVSNDEFYSFVIEANTRAATSTWLEIASSSMGALEVSGNGLDGVVGPLMLGFINPYDYQVRLTVRVGGTTPSITFTALVIPDNQVMG